MRKIFHNFEETPYRCVGMLLPVGHYINLDILDMEPGKQLMTMDNTLVEFVCATKVQAYSEQTRALSLQIYGVPVEQVAYAMFRNWEDQIKPDEMIYLVVKKVEDDTQTGIQPTREFSE